MRHGRRAVLLIPFVLGVAAFAWANGARRPAAASPASPELVALGRELFSSTTAWGQRPSQGVQVTGQRLACSSCHVGPGFTDGRTHLVRGSNVRRVNRTDAPAS